MAESKDRQAPVASGLLRREDNSEVEMSEMDWERRFEWRGNIDEALCVASMGWQTEDEHAVWLGAHDFISKVGRSAIDRSIRSSKCPTCGK